MSTHNTHFATKQDKVIPSSGSTFFALCYSLPDGNIQWLSRNRRFTFHCSSAARFSSFEDAKSFASLDFSNGLCEKRNSKKKLKTLQNMVLFQLLMDLQISVILVRFLQTL